MIFPVIPCKNGDVNKKTKENNEALVLTRSRNFTFKNLFFKISMTPHEIY